jgi:hypothetical protein
MRLVAAKKILRANDQLAEENRAKLNAASVFGLPECWMKRWINPDGRRKCAEQMLVSSKKLTL